MAAAVVPPLGLLMTAAAINSPLTGELGGTWYTSSPFLPGSGGLHQKELENKNVEEKEAKNCFTFSNRPYFIYKHNKELDLFFCLKDCYKKTTRNRLQRRNHDKNMRKRLRDKHETEYDKN